jgi:hypothetical protein
MDEIYLRFLIHTQIYSLEWPDNYEELNDEQKQMVLNFKGQNADLQQPDCQFGVYKPSNYYREEKIIHEICETLNGVLYNMSEDKYSMNQSSIENYKVSIESAIKYEEVHKFNEQGYEK